MARSVSQFQAGRLPNSERVSTRISSSWGSGIQRGRLVEDLLGGLELSAGKTERGSSPSDSAHPKSIRDRELGRSDYYEGPGPSNQAAPPEGAASCSVSPRVPVLREIACTLSAYGVFRGGAR
ncbi:hypothetical protein R1flu_022102 [Riccia fluitans]|uniref:Uncharacterized protein n=1 Tax=Riccia fluitans TaxID=41844 RepID=A0ABD1ZUC6_9MARC